MTEIKCDAGKQDAMMSGQGPQEVVSPQRDMTVGRQCIGNDDCRTTESVRNSGSLGSTRNDYGTQARAYPKSGVLAGTVSSCKSS